jgi:hypothetical protein
MLGHYTESQYAECRVLFIAMLNDIMLSAVMLCHYTECRGAVYSLLVANS